MIYSPVAESKRLTRVQVVHPPFPFWNGLESSEKVFILKWRFFGEERVNFSPDNSKRKRRRKREKFLKKDPGRAFTFKFCGSGSVSPNSSTIPKSLHYKSPRGLRFISAFSRAVKAQRLHQVSQL
ncbi:uncharacterized protein LOC107032426 [Solanum pennellii]|uniref:Uncharacterized protein LOC107032426 n=1 Tax=Solanum pennellii TaxID=28526 RepID=A0ABM1UWR3_SOLPN|nr:uncharacterized protein LOC107032426 [Solanum pennellii]